MKVKDILSVCECYADILHKGRYVCRFEEYGDITNGNVEGWLLEEEVVEIDVNEDGYIDVYC